MTDKEPWQMFPIVLTDHQSVWKERYLEEKKVIVQAIGSHTIVRIYHIGSPAVPGLRAKPTIDVLVEIQDATDTSSLVSGMQKCGYRYLEQPDNPPPHMMFIKGYTSEEFAGQAYHVHVRYQGDWDEIRFRNYLIAHPDAAEEYATLNVFWNSDLNTTGMHIHTRRSDLSCGCVH